jgi:Rrf2 family protein
MIAVHALAVLAYLERRGVERVSSARIARSVNTNAVVIRKLVRVLKRSGLVDAKEGKGGGVRLAKRPGAISLADVYRAVEGESVLGLNRRPKYARCPVSCGMHDAFPALVAEVDEAVARVLGRRTLRQLIARFEAPPRRARRG